MSALVLLVALSAAPEELRYPMDVFVHDWRSCGAGLELGGFALQCTPALTVVVRDFALKATPSVLEQGFKDLLTPFGRDTNKRVPATVTTQAGSLQGVRIAFKGAIGENFLLGVVVPTTPNRSRRIVCIGAATPKIGRACEEAIGAFASANGVKDFLTRPREPWGPPNAERGLLEQVKTVLESAGAVKVRLAPEVVVGSALDTWLVRQDPSLGALGAQSTFTGLGAPVKIRTFDVLSLDKLAAAKGTQALLARFAAGTVRAATAAERKAFYARVPFELGPLPLAVADLGGEVLVLHFEEDKLAWLDLL